MDVKNKFDSDQQIAELKTDIRMVDLQYSAKLVVEQLTEHLKKKEESKDCA